MASAGAQASPVLPRGRPAGVGALARRERRLAYRMLLPTFCIVLGIVLLPLVANFWISFKAVELGDLRPARPMFNEQLRPRPQAANEVVTLRYRVRNSSRKEALENLTFTDSIPAGLVLTVLPDGCRLEAPVLTCALGNLAGGERRDMRLPVTVQQTFLDSGVRVRRSKPQAQFETRNVLTSPEFTVANFKKVFSAQEFWGVLRVTLYYTIFGTLGALLLGLFAAQILHTAFRGRAVLRGLFLFPYVAPVIAVAFAWVLLLDAGPGGTFNAMLQQLGATDQPVNFLGQKYIDISIFGWRVQFPMALSTVIAFESWRYFPLSFLFILARMQSLPADMYEAAEMDGATPLQQFWYLSLPQLLGILSVLFLLRFIWTFNKFDDIFLLTGGAAGTRTLTVDVYEQAFAVSNLGAGAAVAVVVFALLLTFALLFFTFSPQDDD
ncbi:MAG: sugar ABC transporter permease [Gammaproteobacteria bacterium]|nr:sugar ABC transporter permease [Gammaproteobacteria bacterium]